MESRISKKFEELKAENKKALTGYLTCGYPDLDETYELVIEGEKAGIDIMELGIPYSDPVADGPTIQMASEKALERGVNIDQIFDMVKKLREKTQIPLVIMTYYNSVFRYGDEKFVSACSESGIDGLIVPDLPYEERDLLLGLTQRHRIDLVPLVAPTSEDRIEKIVSDATGFVYCISSKGVTGKRSELSKDLEGFMESVRRHTDVPLAIGFGISGTDAVKGVRDICDGVIVGSAIIEKIGEGVEAGDAKAKVIPFIKELRKSLE